MPRFMDGFWEYSFTNLYLIILVNVYLFYNDYETSYTTFTNHFQ